MFKKIQVHGIKWDSSVTDLSVSFPINSIHFSETDIDQVIRDYINLELKKIGGDKYEGFDSFEEKKDETSYYLLGHKEVTYLFTSEEDFVSYVRDIYLDNLEENKNHYGICSASYCKYHDEREVKDFISAFIYFREYLNNFSFLAELDLITNKATTAIRCKKDIYTIESELGFETQSALQKQFIYKESILPFPSFETSNYENLPFIQEALILIETVPAYDESSQVIYDSVVTTARAYHLSSIKETISSFDKEHGLVRHFKGYLREERVTIQVIAKFLRVEINHENEKNGKTIFRGFLHTPD